MSKCELLAKIDRCNHEIKKCEANFGNPLLSDSDRAGLDMGHADWMVERDIWLRDLAIALRERMAA